MIPIARPDIGEEEVAAVSDVLRSGCSIGAGAVVVAGMTIGRFATIGAGAIVTRDVADYAPFACDMRARGQARRLTAPCSARRAAIASAASAGRACSCLGRLRTEAKIRPSAIAPCRLGGINAAGGRSRSAGSQIARSTAKGIPWRDATSATAPLSRSTAAARVAANSAVLAAALVTTLSAPNMIIGEGVPRCRPKA